MKTNFWIFVVLLGLTTGCTIKGRVIDAETQQPIEGAIVFAQWTITHGIGHYWTELYKMSEAVTDKNGDFELPLAMSPSVDTPLFIIFKKGYVAWKNKGEFPNYEKKRTVDKQILPHSVYRLDSFKESYSHNIHYYFMSYGIVSWELKRAPLFAAALEEERERAIPDAKREQQDYERMLAKNEREVAEHGEDNFIDNCLRLLKPGAYRLDDICKSLSSGVKKRIMARSSDKSSSLYRALNQLNIEVVVKNGSFYLIKEKE